MKLSVIIPNYNKEGYLDTLLSHLKEQITDEVEVIVVDDASTDSSKSIINKYRDVFKVYENEHNMYNSYSRNVGIDNARGEYITFIDSDDDIVPDFISIILENIGSGHNGYFFDYNINVKDPRIKIDKGNNTMVWSKVYKKNIIDDNKIRFNVEKFPVGVLGEDLDFNLEFIKATNDIIRCDIPIIIYNWGVYNSVSNSKQVKSVPPLYKMNEEFIRKWFM